MKLSRIALAAPAALLLAGLALAAEEPAEGSIERMPPGAEAPAASDPAIPASDDAASAARPDPAVPAGEAAPSAASSDSASPDGKKDEKATEEEGAAAAPATSDADGEPARSRI